MYTKSKVLFLEDEPTIRDVLKEYMTMSDYIVTATDNGDDAIKLLEEETYDIAVLDVMVPGADGFTVLDSCHKFNSTMPVIMLTALDDDASQLKAFNHFADDYVVKPVSPIILLKRMETVLRRVKAGSSSVNDGLYIKDEEFCAYYNGKALNLTISEFLLLQTLYKAPERVFSREMLILKIYNEDYIGNDRIIDAHVKNLRKKLPIECIRTVVGVGYKFSKEDK